MAAGGIALGGANMWAALRANDPGHRTDGVVIDRPKRKRAKKKTTTPAASVGSGGEMETNVPPTDGLQEKEARTTVPVPDGGDDKETPAAPPRWGDEASEYEEEAAEEEEAEFILVGGVRCRTVKAAVTGVITVGGTDMWDFLCDNGPGYGADAVDGREHEKVAAAVEVAVEETPPTASVANKHETAPAAIVDDDSKVKTDGAAEIKQATSVPDAEEVTDSREEETAPAAIVDDGSKVQADVAAEDKQATTVPDGEEITDGREEKETAAVSPTPSEEEEEVTNKQEEEAAEEETSKEAEKEEVIDVVTTVARPTSTAAVAGGTTVGGANMWAALRDDDPGHGSGRGKRAKRGKKTKKNKKRVAEDSEQADAVDDDGVVQISNGHEGQETPTDELPSKVEEEEEEKTAGSGAVATGGSRCRAAAGTICRAAIAAALLAVWCRFGPIAV